MSKEKKKRFEIEVSRTGTFTPMSGEPVTITRDMLQSMADNYDPTIAESPFVIGHPTINDPAYGQVDSFEVKDFGENDARLVACGDPENVDPWFKTMVGKKRYDKVSLAFFPPKATSNPKPGTWYPKQVGCLGAYPPAVPNLKPGLTQLAFSEDPDLDYSEVIECSYAIDHTMPELFRSLRDWFIHKHGKEVADDVLPSWKVATLEDAKAERTAEESFTSGQGEDAAAFSTPNEENNDMSEKELATAQARIKELEADNAAKQQALDVATVAQIQQRNGDIKAFCDGLVDAGQCLPETATKIGAILKAIPANDTLAFSEGGPKEDMGQALMDTLTAFGKESFDFAEKTKAEDTGAPSEAVGFAAPSGVKVDEKRAQLAAKARKLASEEGISFAEACTRLGA